MDNTWNALDWTAAVLVIIGGLNWGLIGAFGINLVSVLFGDSFVTSAVYILVGLSALYMIYASMKAGRLISSSRMRV